MLNIATPMLNFHRAHAAGTSWRGIFERPAELADGTYKTAGNADDVVGYINFGQRPEAKYSDGNYGQITALAGPIKWLIVGKDTDGNLVLYSEEPLMSAMEYDSNSNSIFDENSNKYSTSNFRRQLQNIYANTSFNYFSPAEQKLMSDTTLTTQDDVL